MSRRSSHPIPRVTPQAIVRACAIALALVFAGGASAATPHDDVDASNNASTKVSTGDANVDLTLELAQERALNADRPDWPAVRARAADLVRAEPGEAGRAAAIRYVLASLGDGHSFYLSAGQLAANLGGARDEGDGKERAPIAQALAPSAGFARLSLNGWVGDGEAAVAQAARQVRQALIESLGEGRCGLILDLSANGGGNMWPMMGGLAPLYDEGLVEVYDGRGGRTELNVRNGALHSGRLRLPNVDLPPLPARPQRIALILGPQTASSGEVVALGFKGQRNARSFGAATAGATSANQGVHLPSGGVLALTIARLLDRDGVAQQGPLLPDERSERPFEAAAQWLQEQCDGAAETSAP
ncbi:carboxyl-terminal processing protease [Lysobacter enzymogenes]|uniref:S41 family peptidase n=1 Tax=Lysobacter enzymogenes TaxID=69 RepID=UPI003395D1E5